MNACKLDSVCEYECVVCVCEYECMLCVSVVCESVLSMSVCCVCIVCESVRV